MVASSGNEAVANARAIKSGYSGMCQKFTRVSWEVGSLYGSAIEAWNGAREKHSGDRTPPVGAPCYYRGGNYGHAVVYVGNGKIRSTDCWSAGQISEVDLNWPEVHWGYQYLGWTGDINGVDLPLVDPGTEPPKPEPPPEDPDMNQYIQASLTDNDAPITLPSEGWKKINWPNVSAGVDLLPEGWAQLKIGKKRFVATLSVRVDPNNADLDSIRTRFVELEDKNGDWDPGNVTEAYIATEHKVTGGTTYSTDTRVQFVPDGRRLQAEVNCDGGGKLIAARLTVLCFQP